MMNLKRNDIGEASRVLLLLVVVVVVVLLFLTAGCSSMIDRMKKDCVCDCHARCGDPGSNIDLDRETKPTKEEGEK